MISWSKHAVGNVKILSFAKIELHIELAKL
jgi:hypothetical protein